jgi:predicted metal-dependent hydrolase
VGLEESRQLMERLRLDAARIAERFELRYRKLEAERPQVSGHYGICYSDGTIRIRLRHATTGRPLKYSSLVSTVCHELAHLRHFDHGLRFQAFYQRLLAWARHEGIYRPGRGVAASPPRPPARASAARRPVTPGPVQLDLF